MPIHPIRNERDHDAALARIARLMSKSVNAAEGAELDALVTLVDAYEAKHFPMDVPDPISVIEFYLDQNGLSRKDLEPMIGSRARVSEVMSGKRNLTLAMIRRLSASWGISADLLIQQSKTRRRPTNVPRTSKRNAA
jgi:HTH-type transcriptional regulator/antitoxin HigA